VETASVEMDNVESQVISGAGVIIRSWGQKANHSATSFCPAQFPTRHIWWLAAT
jgi:hypothetical protein